LSLKVKSDTTS